MGCALSNDAQLNAQLPQNRLQKLELLGKGTHGQVYRSHDAVTDRDYALKIIDKLPADISKDLLNELISSRFPKLKQIIHPSLIHYEAVELKGTEITFLMDVSSIGSIFKKISSEGRLPEVTVSLYTKQMLEGLLQIHSHGFLHKDLKPTNVFLFDNDIVKLADYSIADLYDQRLRELRSANQKLEHIKLNNIPYMAPEVVKNLGITTLSDVWSLGCMVVYMLTGKRPWADLGSKDELFKKVTKSSIPPLPFGITVACEHFLECCLQVIPSQRSKVQDLLDHPFITGSSNYQIKVQPQPKNVSANDIKSLKLTPQHISLKVIEKAEKSKYMNTEESQNNRDYLQYLNGQDNKDCTDRLLTQQTPVSDNKSKKNEQKETRIPKKRSNVFVQSTKESNNQDNYVMLNNKKVKFKTSFYKNRRQHILSTEETEWTSPSRVKVKAVKDLRSKKTSFKEHPMKFQPSLGIHSVLSRYHQGEPVFQNRLRIDTQPCEYEGEDYFKRPLKLLKKKLQQKKEEALFQEKISNATRKLSLMNEPNNPGSEQGQDCSPSRRKNYEQLVINTEVARAQRSRYKQVKEQTQKMREIRRLRWQFQLNKGKELFKTEVPFSFYLQ